MLEKPPVPNAHRSVRLRSRSECPLQQGIERRLSSLNGDGEAISGGPVFEKDPGTLTNRSIHQQRRQRSFEDGPERSGMICVELPGVVIGMAGTAGRSSGISLIGPQPNSGKRQQ